MRASLQKHTMLGGSVLMTLLYSELGSGSEQPDQNATVTVEAEA